jgi:riboflavin synthase
MFTGLVEGTSVLQGFERKEWGARLLLAAPSFAHEMQEGDSLALNGCCLTVTGLEKAPETGLPFDLLQESLDRTNLGAVLPGEKINVERSLRADSRLGGHFVQGHVDTTTAVTEVTWRGEDLYLGFALPQDGAVYLVEKGSIAINGVSLTVAVLGRDSFGVWLIPHTRALTNLGDLQVGSLVNVEYDMLAKHAVRFLELRGGGLAE